MMKNFLTLAFFATLAFACPNSAFSQALSSTDDVTLNIKLHPIQTLLVNNSQKNVDLVYATKDDYKDGISEKKNNHLSIYSTGGYEVKVNAAVATLTGPKDDLGVETITLTPEDGTNAPRNVTYNTITLDATEQVLAYSSVGGVDRDISITYKGKDSDEYLDFYKAGGDTPVVYTTTITYTIVAK